MKRKPFWPTETLGEAKAAVIASTEHIETRQEAWGNRSWCRLTTKAGVTPEQACARLRAANIYQNEFHVKEGVLVQESYNSIGD